MTDTVTPEIAEYWRPHLDRGEWLVWVGRPRPRRALLMLAIAALVLALNGMLNMQMALSGITPEAACAPMPDPDCLRRHANAMAGVWFSAGELICVGIVTLLARWQLPQWAYAVTNKRALHWRRGGLPKGLLLRDIRIRNHQSQWLVLHLVAPSKAQLSMWFLPKSDRHHIIAAIDQVKG